MTIKIKNFFLTYAVLFLISAVTSFTAFNWKLMNNYQKIGVPFLLLVFSLIAYMFFKEGKYKSLSLFFSCFMIGTLFATFGQVYQTGADSYTLFRNWGIFIILPLILTFSYSIFYLFLIVTSLTIYFYSTLYFSDLESIYIATLFFVLVIVTYSFVINKLKLRFNDTFYNSLVIPFYIIFNIVGIRGVLTQYHWGATDQNISVLLLMKYTYPLILGLSYFLGYRIYKKYIILPFSIISFGLFFWAFFTRINEKYIYSFSILVELFYSLVILFIFIVTLIILLKNRPDSEFLEKIYKFVSSILKLIIFLSSIGFINSLGILMNLGKEFFLLQGLVLIILSFYLPKKLNFKENNKLEIISFILGVGYINYFGMEILGASYFWENILVVSTFNIIIYDIVWYFRKNKVMDLFFAVVHYIYFIIFLKDYMSVFNYDLSFNLIFILGLFMIFLQIIFEKKINLSKYKKKINLISYGNNMCFIFNLVFKVSHYIGFSMNKKILKYENLYLFLYNMRELIIIILSMLIVFFLFREKLKDKNLRNNAIKNTIILSVLIIIIEMSSPYIYISRYLIFLILFYAYKGDKWTSYLLNIVLCYQIFDYYYDIQKSTLLEKSVSMLKISGILLLAYLIVKFFVKEFGQNVQNK